MNVQWSEEETECLLSVWASREFQEKLDGTQRKAKLYAELVEVLAKAGFIRTAEQIINTLKKLKSDYRGAKKELKKSGAGYDKVAATAALDAFTFAPSSPSNSTQNDDGRLAFFFNCSLYSDLEVVLCRLCRS